MNSESIPLIMSSIQKLLTYDFESMFCSHVGYIEDEKKMLQLKLDDLESLYREVEGLHKLGNSIDKINENFFRESTQLSPYPGESGILCAWWLPLYLMWKIGRLDSVLY